MPDAAIDNPEPGEKLPPPVHLLVRLELQDRPAKEFSYDFRQNVISLGRDPSNDIQVPLTTVSRRHARIFYEMGDYFLEDLGSTHGTEHNGKKIGSGEKRLLRDGDSIAIMSFSITFKTTAGTLLDRQPGEKTEQLARRMVQEVLSSLGGSKMDPPALRVMNGPDEGKRFEIREEQAEVTMGRSPECDLPLNDQNISRRHCLVKRNWNGFTAQDLGSKNGVLVNGLKIEGAHNIKDGDEIQIGGVKLIFIDPPSRLLDQFGGFGGETIDPRGISQTEQGAGNGAGPVPDQGEVEDQATAGLGGGEHGSEPAPQMDVEPLGGGGAAEGGDAPVMPDLGEDADLKAAAAELPEVARKGVGFEMLILILGAVFLIGAIAVIVFLVM
jgi:pSer/pThr/pTyr-binding forkhead associated (FHA) protein